MNRYLLVILCICLLITKQNTTQQIETPFARNIHNYMWANYLQFNGDAQQASNWYKNIINTNDSAHIHKGYFCFLYETGNFKHIVQLMQRTKNKNTSTQDPEIQLIFARALRQEGRHKEAEELIIKLHAASPKNIEFAFEATQVYISRKELENALHTMDNILNNSPKKPNFFVFYFLKAQIYAQLRNFKNAYANIDICLESNPRFDKGWLLQGIIKEQEGNIPDAIKSYTTYLETTDGSDTKVQQHLLELFLRVNSSHNTHLFKQIQLYYGDIQHLCMLHTVSSILPTIGILHTPSTLLPIPFSHLDSLDMALNI